jgi:hypothetical protein
MLRAALLFVLLLVSFLAGGCATYHAVDLPWEEQVAAGEFARRTDLRYGDRVRVTSGDGSMVEGLLVEWGRLSVTVANTVGGARLVEVPAAEVANLEVWDRGAQGRLTNVLLAIGTTFLIIHVVDQLDEDEGYCPDW